MPDFPENPVLDQTYFHGNRWYRWDGSAWNLQWKIPTASTTELGGIKVGTNLTVDEDGTLHAPLATPGELGEPGANGANGKSAYEIALETDPSTGTKAQWLASLKGAPGDPGKSAYQTALELNPAVGTPAEWLESLKGAPGEPGAPGASIVGPAGPVGPRGPGVRCFVGGMPPDTVEENIQEGEFWINDETGVTYQWHVSAFSSQWVEF
jgi:hypothetical protein